MRLVLASCKCWEILIHRDYRYFFCSDSYNTIASVGVLFATQELKADAVTLGAMLLLVPFAGFAGSYIWYKVKLFFKLKTKTMLVLTTVSMTLLPCFGMLGFVDSSPIGLKNTWELYPFAIWFGFNLGAIESFARTIFAQLTPPGREAEFFGFYELTDKGSSWIGPAMTASTPHDAVRSNFCSIRTFLVLTQAFGSVRYAHIWLYVSFMVSLICLRFVDVPKGAKQVCNFFDLLSRASAVSNIQIAYSGAQICCAQGVCGREEAITLARVDDRRVERRNGHSQSRADGTACYYIIFEWLDARVNDINSFVVPLHGLSVFWGCFGLNRG